MDTPNLPSNIRPHFQEGIPPNSSQHVSPAVPTGTVQPPVCSSRAPRNSDCTGRRRWELAEGTGDVTGHVHWRFGAQTAAGIDFSPQFTGISPPSAEEKGGLPSLPCAAAFITTRDRNLSPVSPYFLLLSPFPLIFLLAPISARGPGSAADQSAPKAAPPPHPSAPSIRSFMGNLGPKPARLEALSYFLHLFPFCSVFVEDKGGRRLRGEQAEESQETKRLFSWKCPGKEAANLGKGEHRAGEMSGGGGN